MEFWAPSSALAQPYTELFFLFDRVIIMWFWCKLYVLMGEAMQMPHVYMIILQSNGF